MREQLRYALGALLIIGAVMSVRYVQGRFDRADERNAVEVVRSFRPAGAPATLDELVATEHGVRPGELRWHGELASGCFGYIRVFCELPGRGVTYRFDVDINRLAIHPGNGRARRLLERFSPGARATFDSGPRHPVGCAAPRGA